MDRGFCGTRPTPSAILAVILWLHHTSCGLPRIPGKADFIKRKISSSLFLTSTCLDVSFSDQLHLPSHTFCDKQSLPKAAGWGFSWITPTSLTEVPLGKLIEPILHSFVCCFICSFNTHLLSICRECTLPEALSLGIQWRIKTDLALL